MTYLLVDMVVVRHLETSGSTTATLYAGGHTSGDTAATEEWTAADFEIKTVTTS